VNASAFRAAPVTVRGTGWLPGDTVKLSGGQLSGTATVGADGTFVQTISGAVLGTSGPAQQPETLTATDEGNAADNTPATGQSADTNFLVANLAFSVNPQEASFKRKVTFRFSGFLPGRAIYAHYVHRGRVAAVQSFGRTSGACGLLRKRELQYPGGKPRYDSYTVQFDDSRSYRRGALPRIVTKLTIVRY